MLYGVFFLRKRNRTGSSVVAVVGTLIGGVGVGVGVTIRWWLLLLLLLLHILNGSLKHSREVVMLFKSGIHVSTWSPLQRSRLLWHWACIRCHDVLILVCCQHDKLMAQSFVWTFLPPVLLLEWNLWWEDLQKTAYS